MPPSIPGVPNLLFKHSQDFDQGYQRRSKRESEIIVAKDGSGDFELLSEAILEINSRGGGTVLVRAGTYNEDFLTLESNVTLKGDGLETVINLGNTNALRLTNVDQVTIKDLRFIFTTTGASEAPIDLAGATNIYFNGISFQKKGASSEALPRGFIWTSNISKITSMKIENCEFENITGGNISAAIIAFIDKCTIINNNFGTLDMFDDTIGAEITNCIVKGNYSGDIVSDAMIETIVTNNQVTGDIKLVTPFSTDSTNNMICNNFVSGTISVATNCNDNVVIGNTTGTPITNSGTRNTVAHNTLIGGGSSLHYWSCSGANFLNVIHTTGWDKANAIWEPKSNDTDVIANVSGIPNGAIITGAVVYGNSVANPWKLRRINHTGTSSDMATASVNTEDTSISNATVDNSTYGYYLSIDEVDLNQFVFGARITYTI